LWLQEGWGEKKPKKNAGIPLIIRCILKNQGAVGPCPGLVATKKQLESSNFRVTASKTTWTIRVRRSKCRKGVSGSTS